MLRRLVADVLQLAELLAEGLVDVFVVELGGELVDGHNLIAAVLVAHRAGVLDAGRGPDALRAGVEGVEAGAGARISKVYRAGVEAWEVRVVRLRLLGLGKLRLAAQVATLLDRLLQVGEVDGVADDSVLTLLAQLLGLGGLLGDLDGLESLVRVSKDVVDTLDLVIEEVVLIERLVGVLGELVLDVLLLLADHVLDVAEVVCHLLVLVQLLLEGVDLTLDGILLRADNLLALDLRGGVLGRLLVNLRGIG